MFSPLEKRSRSAANDVGIDKYSVTNLLSIVSRFKKIYQVSNSRNENLLTLDFPKAMQQNTASSSLSPWPLPP